MGCCKSRDVIHIQIDDPQNRRYRKRKILRRSLQGKTCSQDMNDVELLQQIYSTREQKDYNKLVQFIYVSDPISSAFKNSWALSPTTFGSLCIAYLAYDSKQEIKAISPVVRKILPTLVEFIKKGPQDLRQNSLLLLKQYTKEISDDQVEQILQLNIMNTLVRWFICDKHEMRMISAQICACLYKGRRTAQDYFLLINGGSKLLQLIAWNSEDEKLLGTLLIYLQDLILDENDRPRPENCDIINSSMAWEIVRNINTIRKSASLLEQIDHIISLLSFSSC